MWFRPAKARYDAELELLRRRFEFLLHRELTGREQRWLEFSAPLFRPNQPAEPAGEVPQAPAA